MYTLFTLKGSSLTLTVYTMTLAYKLHHSGTKKSYRDVLRESYSMLPGDNKSEIPSGTADITTNTKLTDVL
uniref:Uncharacterized protein n=1 Tax=Timema poppense TaxID=170557 RepID=A0A7R9DB98_TIMPO|nr:unnamed protein product [Timema poppensis]